MISIPKECNLHGRSHNGSCRYTEYWCEGYQINTVDDEPAEQCKECKFNQFFEGKGE